MSTNAYRKVAIVKLPSSDEPLPLTLRFVLVFGACILIGWFLMFFLLQARA